MLDGPRYASLFEVNRWDMGSVDMGSGGLTSEAGRSGADCYSGATATSKSMRGLWHMRHTAVRTMAMGSKQARLP